FIAKYLSLPLPRQADRRRRRSRWRRRRRWCATRRRSRRPGPPPRWHQPRRHHSCVPRGKQQRPETAAPSCSPPRRQGRQLTPTPAGPAPGRPADAAARAHTCAGPCRGRLVPPLAFNPLSLPVRASSVPCPNWPRRGEPRFSSVFPVADWRVAVRNFSSYVLFFSRAPKFCRYAPLLLRLRYHKKGWAR
ncbi:unnamed protein product, partial [Urochloa humidicola]